MRYSSSAAIPSDMGDILCGPPDSEQRIQVPRATLERSPVIKDWIEDPSSVPPSMRKDGALYFGDCDASVVNFVFQFLGQDPDTAPRPPGGGDALYFTKVYKLAICLAITRLCEYCLNQMRFMVINTETFVKVAITASQGGLVEEANFRSWISRYILENSEALISSSILREVALAGGPAAWTICQVLLTCASLTAPAIQESNGLKGIGLDNRYGTLHSVNSEDAEINKSTPGSKRSASGTAKTGLNPTVEDFIDGE